MTPSLSTVTSIVLPLSPSSTEKDPQITLQHFHCLIIAATTPGQAAPILSFRIWSNLLIMCYSRSAFCTWGLAVLGLFLVHVQMCLLLSRALSALWSQNLAKSLWHVLTAIGFAWSSGNKADSKGDSRQINCGFQVDVAHPMGISARNNSKNGLTECIDSHDMVRRPWKRHLALFYCVVGLKLEHWSWSNWKILKRSLDARRPCFSPVMSIRRTRVIHFTSI